MSPYLSRIAHNMHRMEITPRQLMSQPVQWMRGSDSQDAVQQLPGPQKPYYRLTEMWHDMPFDHVNASAGYRIVLG